MQSKACVQICTISNCNLCASATTCQQCNDGFRLASSRQSCGFNCRIDGCITCSSLTTCSLCSDGSSLNNARTACVVQCSDGQYLVGNSCRNCPTANCLTCDSTGKCTSCVSLFYLDTVNNFVCTACSTISNCFDCEARQAVCKTCRSGFSLINRVCVDNSKCSVNDCKTCVSDNNAACKIC